MSVWLRAGGCGALLLASAHAAAEPVRTLLDNGDPGFRVDVAILGDGFTAEQMEQFHAHARDVRDAFFAAAPLSDYAAFFNVHAVESPSAESGADHPADGELKDTALGGTYDCLGIPRLICVDSALVEGVLNRSLDVAARDIVIVLVNDEAYGGSGGAYAVTSLNMYRDEIILHEIGHSFGLLADEYFFEDCVAGGVDYGAIYGVDGEPPEANATREINRAAIKWNTGGGPPEGWIEQATAVPTREEMPDAVGLYEGARYCDKGYYRPTADSKMRSLGRPWGAVNSEELVKRIHSYAPLIAAASPGGERLERTAPGSEQFSARIVRPTPDTVSVEWLLNGEPVGTGDALTVDYAALGAGVHDLELRVADGTDKVRSDPDGLLEQIRAWRIAVAVRIDGDGDGMPQDWEDRFGLSDGDAGDAEADGDGDGLSNLAEYLAGSDPTRSDSDGDGFSDGEEVADGYGPSDAANSPLTRRPLMVRLPSLLPDSDSDAAPDARRAGTSR